MSGCTCVYSPLLYLNPKVFNFLLHSTGTPVQGYTEDLLYDILDLEIFVGSPFVRKIPWT